MRKDVVNEYLSDLFRDPVVKWKLIFVVLGGLVSGVLTCITKDIYIAVFYIVVTTVLEIFSTVSSTIKLEDLIRKVVSTKKLSRYVGTVLITLAIVPTVVGHLTGEIVFRTEISWVRFLFINCIPNLMGTCIVYSILKHILGLNVREFVDAVLYSKKAFFDVLLPSSFRLSYVMAVGYYYIFIEYGWNWVNLLNSFYLFVVVSCGIICLVVFALRLVHHQCFSEDLAKIYPTKTLYVTTAFLCSHGLAPVLSANAESEIILLAFNIILAVILSIALCYWIKRRVWDKKVTYPYVPIARCWVCMVAVFVLNFVFNVKNGTKIADVGKQLIMGIILLILGISMVSYVNYKQKEGSK